MVAHREGTQSQLTAPDTVQDYLVDIDIDSDNNGKLDRMSNWDHNSPPHFEDSVEGTPPGKVISVNLDDDDGVKSFNETRRFNIDPWFLDGNKTDTYPPPADSFSTDLDFLESWFSQ